MRAAATAETGVLPVEEGKKASGGLAVSTVQSGDRLERERRCRGVNNQHVLRVAEKKTNGQKAITRFGISTTSERFQKGG